MATELLMPRLSDSMEEGTILRWLKGDGDEVRRGEELVEIETDKATMTHEADVGGVLHVVAAEGDTLPVGAVIARVGADAGDGAAAAAEPAAQAEAGGDDGEDDEVTATAVAAEPAPTPAPAGNGAAVGERVKASPLARRIAEDRGVDLRALAGSGPGGRIVRADVEDAGEAAAAPESPAPAAPGGAKGEVEVVEPSRTQAVIARRMSESRATIPDFTVTAAVDAEAAFALVAELKQVTDPAPSLNDLVIKACGVALREHPRVNGSYRDGRFELHGRVNVGMAVAAEDALVVPTVFDADRKPVAVIAAETRALAAKVRDGTVRPPDLSGGTFSVSNLGMFGVDRFTAVINPPQAAILAVGAATPRARAGADGAVVLGRSMDLTLSCDHRILYGADAARFLARVRELLERPLALLV